MIAHLGGDFVFAGGLGELAGFPDGMRERFFTLDMLAVFHRGHRDKGVEMIGCGDHDSVDVLLLVEHFAKVGEDFGFWIFFEGVAGVVGVDVA